MQALDQLLAAHPDYAEAHHNRGMMLADSNRAVEAVASYERAVALKPDHSKARWSACMAALPILYAEEAEIDRQRAEYERRLRALSAAYEAGQIPGDMFKGLGMAQPFFLAYQGRNDRDLQKLFGELGDADHGERNFHRPSLPRRPRRASRSASASSAGFFWQHSVWKVGVKGWVTQLDPQRFKLFGYHTSHKEDAETALAKEHCHRFVQGPHTDRAMAADHPGRPAARPPLPRDRHEPRGRRARRACGLRRCNAATSAIRRPAALPTIDYFLSGELIEPPTAASITPKSW